MALNIPAEEIYKPVDSSVNTHFGGRLFSQAQDMALVETRQIVDLKLKNNQEAINGAFKSAIDALDAKPSGGVKSVAFDPADVTLKLGAAAPLKLTVTGKDNEPAAGTANITLPSAETVVTTAQSFTTLKSTVDTINGTEATEGSYKKYVKTKIDEVNNTIASKMSAVYNIKGSTTETDLKANKAGVKKGDVFNLTSEVTITGVKYPAGTNVVMLKEFAAGTAIELKDSTCDALSGIQAVAPKAVTIGGDVSALAVGGAAKTFNVGVTIDSTKTSENKSISIAKITAPTISNSLAFDGTSKLSLTSSFNGGTAFTAVANAVETSYTFGVNSEETNGLAKFKFGSAFATAPVAGGLVETGGAVRSVITSVKTANKGATSQTAFNALLNKFITPSAQFDSTKSVLEYTLTVDNSVFDAPATDPTSVPLTTTADGNHILGARLQDAPKDENTLVYVENKGDGKISVNFDNLSKKLESSITNGLTPLIARVTAIENLLALA